MFIRMNSYRNGSVRPFHRDLSVRNKNENTSKISISLCYLPKLYKEVFEKELTEAKMGNKQSTKATAEEYAPLVKNTPAAPVSFANLIY